MDYVLHIVILIGIYVILSASLDLVVGYAGLLSLAHAAFYAIGAYTCALLTSRCGAPFLSSMAVAVLLSASMGLVVGVISLRFRSDYFVISTFAFQVIVFGIINNWVELTRGPIGVPGIPPPTIWGYGIVSPRGVLVLVGVCAAIVMFVKHQIVRAPMGRVLRAIREDEVVAVSAGKSVLAQKMAAFVIGAGIAGGAGSLYSGYVGFIDPSSFSVAESIFVVSIVIIGGAGSLWGPVLGASVLVAVPEVLRSIGLPSAVSANLRQILYGGVLVMFMLWRPRGLLGRYDFRAEGGGR